GSGAIALQAAERVGSEGRVVGSDIAASMLRIARQNAVKRGKTNLTFLEMDAEHLGFSDASFDIVTCGFSLFQFPNMRQALKEMERVVKRGGQIGLSNWGTGYFSPVADMQRKLFQDFGLRPLLTNPITFKHDELQMLLEWAGLTELQLESDEMEVWFKDPQAVWDYNMSMGPFPVMLRRQLTADQSESLHERFIEKVSAIASPQGVRCTFHLLYALARKT
ncbi:MAG: class I SAM-dependent methyltransferase, partial [Anaerolineales bacterium]|nr:class I SAM-dependent methyltransferase [Anaerolineales bacterium]